MESSIAAFLRTFEASLFSFSRFNNSPIRHRLSHQWPEIYPSICENNRLIWPFLCYCRCLLLFGSACFFNPFACTHAHRQLQTTDAAFMWAVASLLCLRRSLFYFILWQMSERLWVVYAWTLSMHCVFYLWTWLVATWLCKRVAACCRPCFCIQRDC